MPAPNEPVWTKLPDSAQQTIIMVMELLGGGFTGKIELECVDGGVKRTIQSIPWRPRNVADGKG